MAITSTPAGLQNPQFLTGDASASFVSFGDFIQYVNKPEYEDRIKEIYMQELGITELLSSLGRECALDRDWETLRIL